MARKRVLITVTTYPLPSRSYDELVCTAGMLENGEWIRIYPVPLSFLIDLKDAGKVKNVKYTWIEIDLNRRGDDFRPESHSPVNYDFRDIVIGDRIGTQGNWMLRKDVCLNRVYTNKNQLLEDSKAPQNVSLATFKPANILSFEVEEDTREWKEEWAEIRKQTSLFDTVKPIETLIPKLPYKFYYRFTDDAGVVSKLMIEDWEIGALFWNCLRTANGDEGIALRKVRQQYEDNFIKNKDIYLFLGTTKEWHRRRATNPFVIIGVFYPKIELQGQLF
ncbi:MAG: hypothetical protein CVT99_15795 [Bacteroidetes bacterium HGW-Bacteroidetes-16]|jgi:hypothetical protein|nr:MAG: hypothetical protein CVT99_15795 [Bacteroidetes bacterium HGW-Bacteroidetes-16]